MAEFPKQNFEENSLKKFLEVCNKALDEHLPHKSKFVRGNHSPFMNRELSKAIITRTRLRNKFFKEKTVENRKNYNKQRNYCATLLRNVKKEFYDSLDEKHVTDNKTFRKTVKSFLSDKAINSGKIASVEKYEIITNEEKMQRLSIHFSLKLFLTSKIILLKTMILFEGLIQ